MYNFIKKRNELLKESDEMYQLIIRSQKIIDVSLERQLVIKGEIKMIDEISNVKKTK